LNKSVLSLIDVRFFDVFAPEDDGDPDHLVLVSPDKTRQRRCLARHLCRGYFTDIVLFEEVESILGGVTFSGQLSSFLLPVFSEWFSVRPASPATVSSGFYLFFRADPTILLNSAEAFFAAVSNLGKSFQNAKVVHMDGSLLTIALPGLNSIACLFFLRNAVLTRNIGPYLSGIILDHRPEVRFSVDLTDEPYVVGDDERLNETRVKIASIGKGFIGTWCLEKLPSVFQSAEIVRGIDPELAILRLPDFLGLIEALVH
jgi:hypothetical protein